MYNYSLEESYQKIHNIRTKEYFKEVLSSYHNSNFRAATVTLYSVLICDLLHKLEELKDLYNDEKAIKILKEIQEEQKKNPKKPDWENSLIDKIKERTQLLEEVDYQNILHLKNYRNLSAHPVLDKENKLFTPNSDQVRAHMRNILEGILTKPPFFSKKIFDFLVEDLASKRNILVEQRELNNYLENKYNKYLSYLIAEYIFKHLWKVVFKLNNPKANENREINYKALLFFYNHWKIKLNEAIRQDKNPVINQIDVHDDFDAKADYLIDFFNQNIELWNYVAGHVKTVIKEKVKNSHKHLIVANFLHKSLDGHIETINNLPYFHNRHFYIAEFIESNIDDNKSKMIKYIIERYTKSLNYNEADLFFIFISKYIEEFTREDIEVLVRGISNNDQTYNRSKAIDQHPKIVEFCQRKFPDINISQYDNWSQFIQKSNNSFV